MLTCCFRPHSSSSVMVPTCALVLVVLILSGVSDEACGFANAFSAVRPTTRRRHVVSPSPLSGIPVVQGSAFRPRQPGKATGAHESTRRSSFSPCPPAGTALFMVPPRLPGGPGGGGGGDNKLSDALPAVLSVLALTAFFFSPLGGLFFAATNLLFAIALITPFFLWAGLQIWATFNTVQGECPSCGAPVVVPKGGGGGMTGDANICFNCGSLVRATEDGKGVELCNAPPGGTFFDDREGVTTVVEETSWTDAFFGGGGGQRDGVERLESPSSPSSAAQGSKSKPKGNVIDVEVERDE